MDKSLSTQVQSNFPDLQKPTVIRRFALKRIGLDDLFLTDDERVFLVTQLNDGVRFVHIGEETIAASAIKSISPRYSAEEMQKEIDLQGKYEQLRKND